MTTQKWLKRVHNVGEGDHVRELEGLAAKQSNEKWNTNEHEEELKRAKKCCVGKGSAEHEQ